MSDLTKELLRLFPNGGWFVEAGAHDGVGDSQTFELEQAGWNGLCIEPSSAFVGLQISRRCKVDNRCLWKTSGQVAFRQLDGNAVEMSGVIETLNERQVRENMPHVDSIKGCATLTEMLIEHDAPPVIEFLSLDTEGSEHDILLSHDFNRYRFLYIEVEHLGGPIKLLDLLLSKGYDVVRVDAANLFFLWNGVK